MDEKRATKWLCFSLGMLVVLMSVWMMYDSLGRMDDARDVYDDDMAVLEYRAGLGEVDPLVLEAISCQDDIYGYWTAAMGAIGLMAMGLIAASMANGVGEPTSRERLAKLEGDVDNLRDALALAKFADDEDVMD